MKKYSIYFLALCTTIAIIFNLTAFRGAEKKQTDAFGYILLEIYEIPSYKDKGVHIHYGNAKTEIIPFKDFVSSNHSDNGDIILSAVNKLVEQGYTIEHTAAGLAEGGMITKIFMKKNL
jgi:hypothetical protein